MVKIVLITKQEKIMIKKKYPDFKVMNTGEEKSNHNRKKYYIQPYVLFSETNDIVFELEKYVEVYEMISRGSEAEQCYQDLKKELGKQKNYRKKTQKLLQNQKINEKSDNNSF